MTGDLQLDLLAERPAQVHRIGAAWLGRRGQRERLKIAAIRPGGSQTGLAELAGDIVRGQPDPFGADAASLAFVRSEKRDVLPHPRFNDGRIVRRAEPCTELQNDQ